MSNGKQTQQNRQRKRAVASVYFVLLLMLLVLGGATAFLWISLPSRNQEREASVPLFGVQEVAVTGDTRYSTEDIAAASGIHIGQSIFSLNKVAAHDTILASFPYLESVEIFNNSLNTVEIRVTEAEAIGALYWNGSWLVVGSSGKGLETLPLQGDVPPRYLYLRGAAVTEEAGVGRLSLGERSCDVVNTLLRAFEQYEFTGISEIDLTDLSDIRLRLNDRITIKLGNATQLTYQVAVLAESLPYVYESYGKKAEGLLDISSYSNEDSTDMVVFTSQDVLDQQLSDTGTTAGGTTDSTTASGGGTESTTGAEESPDSETRSSEDGDAA